MLSLLKSKLIPKKFEYTYFENKLLHIFEKSLWNQSLQAKLTPLEPITFNTGFVLRKICSKLKYSRSSHSLVRDGQLHAVILPVILVNYSDKSF